MKIFFLLISLFFFKPNLSVNKSNSVIKCKVVKKLEGCDYFLCITTDKDFILMEWYGGDEPEFKDIIYGEFNQYGFINGYNKTKDQKFKVYIEDYGLSAEDGVAQLIDKCE